MKKVHLIVTSWCPYCKQALHWIDQLKRDNPSYAQIQVEVIDEEKEPEKINKAIHYYYVPTLYIEDEKLHEGKATKEGLRQIFEQAIG